MSGISDVIGVALPWLTAALGGPIGIATMAATKIAGVLGLSDSTVAAVRTALAAGSITPEQQLALTTEEHSFELQMRQMGFTASHQMRADDNETLSIINNTMQGEQKIIGNWYAMDWRPTWGYASAAMFVYVCTVAGVMGLYAVFKAQSEMFDLIPKFIMAFIPLFGIAGAVLGIQAWKDGTADQIIAKIAGGVK